MIERAAQLMAERSAAGEFSGVVTLRRDGVDLFAGAYGLAHRGWAVPNGVDTRFRVASIGKVFTAVAALQLIERGLLALDTSVVDRLDLRDTAIPAEVTVEHLLTMTAGIADWLDETGDVDAEWERLRREIPIYLLRTDADYLPLFADKPPVHPVGARHAYSNASYLLLGLLIERAAGRSYEDHVRQHVFAPAGMARTDFIAIDDVADSVAEGYLPVPGEAGAVVGWRRNVYAVTAGPAADGGVSSTAGDLGRFLDAVRAGRLLSPAMTAELLTPKVVERDDRVRGYRWRYGYGLFFLLDDDDRIVRYGLPGEEDGVSCRLFHYPAQNVDLAVLGNQSGCAFRPGWELHDLIIGQAAEI